MIALTCPNTACGRKLQISDCLVGQTIICTSCKTGVYVDPAAVKTEAAKPVASRIEPLTRLGQVSTEAVQPQPSPLSLPPRELAEVPNGSPHSVLMLKSIHSLPVANYPSTRPNSRLRWTLIAGSTVATLVLIASCVFLISRLGNGVESQSKTDDKLAVAPKTNREPKGGAPISDAAIVIADTGLRTGTPLEINAAPAIGENPQSSKQENDSGKQAATAKKTAGDPKDEAKVETAIIEQNVPLSPGKEVTNETPIEKYPKFVFLSQKKNLLLMDHWTAVFAQHAQSPLKVVPGKQYTLSFNPKQLVGTLMVELAKEDEAERLRQLKLPRVLLDGFVMPDFSKELAKHDKKKLKATEMTFQNSDRITASISAEGQDSTLASRFLLKFVVKKGHKPGVATMYIDFPARGAIDIGDAKVGLGVFLMVLPDENQNIKVPAESKKNGDQTPTPREETANPKTEVKTEQPPVTKKERKTEIANLLGKWQFREKGKGEINLEFLPSGNCGVYIVSPASLGIAREGLVIAGNWVVPKNAGMPLYLPIQDVEYTLKLSEDGKSLEMSGSPLGNKVTFTLARQPDTANSKTEPEKNEEPKKRLTAGDITKALTDRKFIQDPNVGFVQRFIPPPAAMLMYTYKHKESGANISINRDIVEFVGLEGPGQKFDMYASHDEKNLRPFLEIIKELSPQLHRTCEERLAVYKKSSEKSKHLVGNLQVFVEKDGLHVASVPHPFVTENEPDPQPKVVPKFPKIVPPPKKKPIDTGKNEKFAFPPADEIAKLVEHGGKHWSSMEKVGKIAAGKEIWIWPAEDRIFVREAGRFAIKLHWSLRPGASIPNGTKIGVSTCNRDGSMISSTKLFDYKEGMREGTVEYRSFFGKPVGQEIVFVIGPVVTGPAFMANRHPSNGNILQLAVSPQSIPKTYPGKPDSKK